jgi:hypothetical protein
MFSSNSEAGVRSRPRISLLHYIILHYIIFITYIMYYINFNKLYNSKKPIKVNTIAKPLKRKCFKFYLYNMSFYKIFY